MTTTMTASRFVHEKDLKRAGGQRGRSGLRCASAPTQREQAAGVVAYRITGGSAIQGPTIRLWAPVGWTSCISRRQNLPIHFTDPEDGIVFITYRCWMIMWPPATRLHNHAVQFHRLRTNVSYATNGTTVLSNVVILRSNERESGENRTLPLRSSIWDQSGQYRSSTRWPSRRGATGYFRISHDGSTNRAVTVDLSISGTAASGTIMCRSVVGDHPGGTNGDYDSVYRWTNPEEESAESVIVAMLAGLGLVSE